MVVEEKKARKESKPEGSEVIKPLPDIGEGTKVVKEYKVIKTVNEEEE